jgi:ATP-binding protein involved in chromosome partitioning
VPLLAEVPLETAMRAGGDHGRPLVATDPESPAARAIAAMAKALI